jgi:transposase
MQIPIAAPKALLADKGYDRDRFRQSLLVRGILPIIPPARTARFQSIPTIADTGIVTASSLCSEKLKQQRRIATRYDKTVLSFKSFLNLTAARLWVKSLVNAT